MNRRIKLLLSTVVAMAAIPITNASAYVEMPIYSLSPANGSHLTWPAGNGSTDVVFTSLPENYYNMIAGIVFEVSTSNALGRDGTLSDDYVFDYDYVHLGDGAPGEYRTRLQHQLYTPGVKYFDFWGYTYEHEFMKSPVFSFTYEPTQITAPAPIAPLASMTKAQAIEDIKSLIKIKTGRRPSYLSSACSRTSAASFSCSAGFTAKHQSFNGRFNVSVYYSGSTLYWTGSFNGHRGDGKRVKWRL